MKYFAEVVLGIFGHVLLDSTAPEGPTRITWQVQSWPQLQTGPPEAKSGPHTFCLSRHSFKDAESIF